MIEHGKISPQVVQNQEDTRNAWRERIQKRLRNAARNAIPPTVEPTTPPLVSSQDTPDPNSFPTINAVDTRHIVFLNHDALPATKSFVQNQIPTWEMNPLYQDQGYRPYTELLTGTERKAIRQTDIYDKFIVRDNGKILIRPEDIDEFRQERKRNTRRFSRIRDHQWSMSPHYAIEGYVLCTTVLTENEISVLRRAKQYQHLFIRDNGRLIMQQAALEEYRRLRKANEENRRTIRPEDSQWYSTVETNSRS